MSMFTNGVGRPSNETIRKRNIFKGICVAFGLIIIALVGYILNDKGIINLSNNKKGDNEKVVTTNKVDSDKYKDLNFVDATKISDTYLPILDSPNGEIEIVDGKVILTQLDDNKNEVKQYKTTGIDSKVKYITYFNVGYWDLPIGPLAALTENNELYIAQPNSDTKSTELEFKLFEKNITNMLIVHGTNPDQDDLYLLTIDNDLRRVKSSLKDNSYTYTYTLSNELYEDRIIYLGNYHEGGISHHIVIKPKNNTISFAEDYGTTGFKPIKFNGKNIVVKNVLIHENETSTVYIVTKYNNLLTTKKSRSSSSTPNNCEECYEFKKYNDLKVKDIKYSYEHNDIEYATIVFSDNSTLKIENFPHVYSAE